MKIQVMSQRMQRVTKALQATSKVQCGRNLWSEATLEAYLIDLNSLKFICLCVYYQ